MPTMNTVVKTMSESALVEKVVTEQDKKRVAKIKKSLSSGVNYISRRGYDKKWAEYQRFWESDQWPEATEETKNFPRPVTNHFSEIIEMKVSGLTYEKPEMYFEPKKGCLREIARIPVQPLKEEDEPFEVKSNELLGTVFEHVADLNDMDEILEEQARSAALTGNGIVYSYWDNTVMASGEGGSIGEIAVMLVDVSDFYVGDPKEPDLQKQPYAIITERRPREQVIAEYEEHSEFAKLLKPEPQSTRKAVYDHDKLENEETDYVDLIHYWERKIVSKETEFEGEDGKTETLKTREYQVDYTVVAQDYVLREEEDHYLSKLYPFSNLPWIPGRKSFYAKSEADDLINNQKELNRLQGIAILGAYKTGLPNMRYKENFVQKEDLSVGPGGHIIKDDTPPGQGWSVDFMNPPQIAPYIPMLKDAMAQGMKDSSGVHEAWSGKAPSAHLNASAIMALQEAAGVRIRPIQRRLHRAYRDLGRIWLGYMEQYYTEERLYKVFGKNGTEGTAWLRPDDFKGFKFDVKVSMGSASPYSKTVIAATLENLLDKGVIDGDLFLRMFPQEVMPKVGELLELMEERIQEQQEMVMQQQIAVIDEIVAQTVEQARAQGVEITPEALEQMTAMIQQHAEESGV